MTVLNPTLNAFDDVREITLAMWGSRIYLVALRAGTLGPQIDYRVEGTGPAEWRPIDTPDHAFSGHKKQLSSCVIGNELCLAWANEVTGKIMFARATFGGGISLRPVEVLTGSSPSLSPWRTTNLFMAFVNNGQHRYITSENLGESWRVPPVQDQLGDAGSGNITAVDVTMSKVEGADIIFAEADLPLAGE